LTAIKINIKIHLLPAFVMPRHNASQPILK
jgi:hypothetical protein